MMKLQSALGLGALLLPACLLSACASEPGDEPHEPGQGSGASGGNTAGTGGESGDMGSGGATVPGTGGAPIATGGTTSSSGGDTAGTGGEASSSGGDTMGTGGVTNEAEYMIHATFQSQSLGAYARADVADDFGAEAPWDNGLSQGRAAIEQEEDNLFLRVTYPANQYGPNDGGVQFEVDLGGSYNELFFSYKVRFASGFNFMKGGKLPGLVGGSSPSGCTTDKTGGFSARNMWRTAGDVDQYLYYPDRQNNCGDDWYYKDGDTTLKFQPGTWHTLEHRLVMGTAGQGDGLIEAWFDGKLALSRSLLWKVTGATYGIDALYFSTFFGGGDNSWAPPSNQQADFDDFIVSESPITH